MGARVPAGSDAPGLARLLANLRSLVDLPRLLESCHRSGAPVARLDAGPYPVAYVNSPAAVTAVLDGGVDGVAERGRFFQEISRVIGTHSLVTCEGEEHRRLRRLLSGAFRPDQVATYAATMLATIAELTTTWRDGDELVLGDAMGRLTLEIAARALLGLERAEQLDDFAEVLHAGTQVFYRLLLPRPAAEALWRSRLSSANRRLRGAQARVDRFVGELLAERRRRQPEAAIATPGRPANLLDVLLGAAQHGGSLTDAEVRDQIVTFLFAGHETTAQALTWTFVLLDRNPAERAGLEGELDGVLAGRPPAVGDLSRLPRARAVVRESLRLYPPAWFLSRGTLRPTVVEGCPVPAGALVLSSPLALHRDPARFSDPLRFDPGRWLGLDGAGGAPEGYLPFGHGRRTCIGSSFALTELVLAVATIAQRWRLRLVEPDRIRERPTVTLRPRRPVRVVLDRRPARQRA